MSERIPTAEDIRLALIEVGYTHYEADDAIEAVKRDRDDRITTLLDTKKTHERVIAELRHDMSLARSEIVDLRDENDRLERILQAPLSIESLAAAWEAAEVADECREGDVLIIRDDEDNYLVRRMDDRSRLDSTARILSRSPREPWAELADIIGRYEGDTGDPAGLAQFLHENEVTTPFDHDGVRVTGGDA